MLARTETVAVAVVGATAYSTGVELSLVIRRRPIPWTEADDEPFGFPQFDDPLGHTLRYAAGAELKDEVLRFGVQFADGRKATTLDLFRPWRDSSDVEKPDIVLQQGGGGGGGSEWEWSYWLWPLPPAGPLTFVIEWPSENVELTRHEIDAGPILDAAGKSEVLWPEQDWSRGIYLVQRSSAESDEPPAEETT